MPVMMNTLFTIGHSDHIAGQFVSLLRLHGVEAVADVRSHPYSQRLPQLNRESLMTTLETAKIRYVFLGPELGARREEQDCYVEGRADYRLIAKTAAFQEGVKRVEQGLFKMKIALMCAEHDPVTCHRMILVCRHLRDRCPTIQHILKDGRLESNQESEIRLLKEIGAGSGLVTSSLIDKAYDLQGQLIAYTDECLDNNIHDEQTEMHMP
jgi:uncharacterized protein (DUF488 family)